MFGALGMLSGSKNPIINPTALFDKKKTPPTSDVQSRQSLSPNAAPRYGAGATSLSV